MAYALVSFIAVARSDTNAAGATQNVSILEGFSSTPVALSISATPWDDNLPECPAAAEGAFGFHRVKVCGMFDPIIIAIGDDPDPEAASTPGNRVHWCAPGVVGYFFCRPGEKVSAMLSVAP